MGRLFWLQWVSGIVWVVFSILLLLITFGYLLAIKRGKDTKNQLPKMQAKAKAQPAQQRISPTVGGQLEQYQQQQRTSTTAASTKQYQQQQRIPTQLGGVNANTRTPYVVDKTYGASAGPARRSHSPPKGRAYY